jgi:hypothetical protein
MISQDTEDLLSPTRDESPSTLENDVSQFLAKLEEQKREEAEKTRGLINETSSVIAAPPTIVVDTTVSREVQWQRRLTLRKCINIQNLVGKKSGLPIAPAPGKASQLTVTSVAFSKDHKALHVGDSQGRVTTWLATGGKFFAICPVD